MDCKKCGTTGLTELDFHKKVGGRRTWCKACAKLSARESYIRNRALCIAREVERKRRLYASVGKLKSGPCNACGLSFPFWAMEFDHLHGKIDGISSMVRHGKPLGFIEDEVQKCHLLCVLCHRVTTKSRVNHPYKARLPNERRVCPCSRHGLSRVSGCRGCNNARRLETYYLMRVHENIRVSRSKKERKASLVRKLKDKPCTDCRRVLDPVQLDFDHVRGEKLSNIARLLADSSSALTLELNKCDLVCAVCHRFRTRVRLGSHTLSDVDFITAWRRNSS